MNAKKGTRYYKERTPLETVIPLDTPYVLFVDPSSVCNLKCAFCPCGRAHEDLWSEQKSVNVMSLELFKKIIDDCKGFNSQIKTLRLYKEGEPLINAHLPEMIAYAKGSGKFRTIDLTTNGTLLSPKLNRKLVDAGLTRINISVEALTEQDYEILTGVRLDVEEFRKNIEDFYKHKGNCHVFIKILENSLQEKTEQDFYDLYGDICDEIAVEHVTYCWPEFNLDKPDTYGTNIYGEELQALTVCPHIFYTICVNSNGSVSICFVDWNHKLIVGDVNRESIADIWNGPEMNRHRIENLRGNRCRVPVCQDCGQIKYASIDNIDPYCDKLLERFK